jgi:hypothetical protein
MHIQKHEDDFQRKVVDIDNRIYIYIYIYIYILVIGKLITSRLRDSKVPILLENRQKI